MPFSCSFLCMRHGRVDWCIQSHTLVMDIYAIKGIGLYVVSMSTSHVLSSLLLSICILPLNCNLYFIAGLLLVVKQPTLLLLWKTVVCSDFHLDSVISIALMLSINSYCCYGLLTTCWVEHIQVNICMSLCPFTC